MTKEALFLLLLVGGVAVGIIYVIRNASSNEAEWESYRQIKIGDSYNAVKARFGTVSEDMTTVSDARTHGHASAFKELVEAGGSRMFVVPANEDLFLFGFDKDGKLMYKNFRRP